MKIPQYRFTWAELWWWLLSVIAPILLWEMANFDPSGVSDWYAYGMTIFTACVRAVGGAALALVREVLRSEKEYDD